MMQAFKLADLVKVELVDCALRVAEAHCFGKWMLILHCISQDDPKDIQRTNLPVQFLQC